MEKMTVLAFCFRPSSITQERFSVCICIISIKMDSQQDDYEVYFVVGGGCDESKCVSRGYSHLHNDSFTCYGGDAGSLVPRMCADGFLPLVVEDEATNNTEMKYFTCCPPWEKDSSAVVRRCSDPIIPSEEEGLDDDICNEFGNKLRNDPREMNAAGENPISIVCCYHSDYNEAAMDFLEETECVPYRNNQYEAARVQNKIGKLDVVFCDLYGFAFARPLDDFTQVSSDGRYQCCREGPSLPTFVHDGAFNITVYSAIGLFAIATLLSAIVAIGLLIPLFIEILSSRMPKRESSNTRFRFSFKFSTSNFGSHTSEGSLSQEKSQNKISKSSHFESVDNLSSGELEHVQSHDYTQRVQCPEQQHRRRSSVGNLRAGRLPPKKYSTYNLYLAYLALIDLLYCSYAIWEYQRYVNQTFDPSLYVTIAVSSSGMRNANTPRDEPTMAPYVIANMWINVIICRQVLVLLRASYNHQRSNQPSILKVNLQVGGVCLISAIAGAAFYYIITPAWEARNMGDLKRYESFYAKVRPVLLLVAVVIPLVYVIFVTVLIWWKGYLPPVTGKSRRKKAVRELTLYVFRIVAVFIGHWLPWFFFRFLADFTGQVWPDLLAQYAVAIQPIVSTCLVLTKSDSKKYILDFVTLAYFFGESSTCCKKETNEKGTSRTGTAEVASHSESIEIHFERDSKVIHADEEDHEENEIDLGEGAESLIFSMLSVSAADVDSEAESILDGTNAIEKVSDSNDAIEETIAVSSNNAGATVDVESNNAIETVDGESNSAARI